MKLFKTSLSLLLLGLAVQASAVVKNVDEKIEKNLALINEDKEFAIDFGMNRVGMPPLLMRQGIYKGLY